MAGHTGKGNRPRSGRALQVTLPWHQRLEKVDRVLRVYHKYFIQGKDQLTISFEEGVSTATIVRDVRRAREIALTMLKDGIESMGAEAVMRRQAIQRAAFDDRDTAALTDASGRAALLRVVGEEQSRVEELMGIRKVAGVGGSSQAVAQAAVFVLGDGSARQRSVEQFTDEELDEIEQKLATRGGNGATPVED